ncbi:hypothetical protein [Klenkia soli]|uniref:hypothetical protein n=1 Tax=Klenkia soli TaxID=1052260 RepID=UPI0010425ACB|nr:hypothetical protein [Klenkia soli]
MVAVLALGLAGCSDPGTPSNTLPTAATTSAEPTLALLGPADFPVPAEAREQTEAGALAMATYYLDLIDLARSSMNGEPFLALSDGCETCDQLAAGFDAERAAGNRYDGADLMISSVGPIVLRDRTADLTLTMSQAASTLLDASGQAVPDRSTPATRLSGGLVLEWDSVRTVWLVTQLNAEQY